MYRKVYVSKFVSPLARVVWLLTVERRRRQFAFVHAVDGAVGAHGATRSEAVEHLARLDQRFASQAAREFTVGLGQRGENITLKTRDRINRINNKNALMPSHLNGKESFKTTP